MRSAPQPVGPYSHVVTCDGFVFVSGQTGDDPATGRIVEGGIERQTAQALENLKNILSAVGCALNDVVKVTVFLTAREDFEAMNRVYGAYFKSDHPVRATVCVAALIEEGAVIEIDAVAVRR